MDKPPLTLAAVDLGSNSFHLIVSRLAQGELRRVDRVRDRVCMASGLDADRKLDEASQARGLNCLERFRERLIDLPHHHVRAVGTNTFRRARNARAFLEQAEEILGHSIEVISGQEEARLIHVGVTDALPPTRGRRLIVDIGGGSTECILSHHGELIAAESHYMGCVSHSQRFFPDGELTRDRFKKAVVAAQVELQGFESTFGPEGRSECIGSSGTVHAVSRVLRALDRSSGGAITLDGLKRVRKLLIQAGKIDRIDLPELKADRQPVLPGGLAVLIALFESFEIDVLNPAPGGLREGLLVDLQRRVLEQDVRDRSVSAVQRRFYVDEAQARRVENTARELWLQAREAWNLDCPEFEQTLSWAARLHEVGLAISHTGSHKHAEYLVKNFDMAGFSRDEQLVLGSLLRNQRKKVQTGLFEDLSLLSPKQALRLCALLRLAILLHRTRRAEELPKLRLRAAKGELSLRFPSGWLEEHPLAREDLTKETAYLAGCGLSLTVES